MRRVAPLPPAAGGAVPGLPADLHAVPRRLPGPGGHVLLLDGLGGGAAARGLRQARPGGRLGLRSRTRGDGLVPGHEGGAGGRGEPVAGQRGRAHPQGDARPGAAQAGRRAVPGLDRQVRALARGRRGGRGGRDRLGLLAALALARGGRGGLGPAPHPLRRGRPLLAVDPGGVGRLLRGEGRQPLLPVPLHLRRGPLAGLGLHRLLALPLHGGHPARPHDHLPGRGAARAHPAGGGARWRWPGRSPSWPPHGWFGCGPSRGIPRPRPDRPPCSASPSSAPRLPSPPSPATCPASRCATGGSTTSSTAGRGRSAR